MQALSDLEAREILADSDAAKCHRLHFLQMAAEKTCKAYRVDDRGVDAVTTSHAWVMDTLPAIAREFYARLNNDAAIADWKLSQIRAFAREIELLSPACKDGGGREDNSEYPWRAATGGVLAPCEYNFPELNDGDRAIVDLIRLIRTAAEQYAQ